MPSFERKLDMPPIKSLFEQRCENTFRAARDIFRTRGDQYGDTMRDSQHLALKAAIFQMYGLKPTKVQCEAMLGAVLYDVKYQRLQGGYDPDHPLDGINYAAYFHDAMAQVYREAAIRNPQS